MATEMDNAKGLTKRTIENKYRRLKISLKGNAHHIINELLKEGIYLSNQLVAHFIKIYQAIKKLYAFEVSIYSFMEATIFVCL